MVPDESREKAYQEYLKKLSDEVEKKEGKPPEVIYEEREQRLRDVIELKVPDRVPVVLATSYFPARWAGNMTPADSYYNHEAWREATMKMMVDLSPDVQMAQAGGPGKALSTLGPHLLQWPGDGLPGNSLHQVIEGEPLKPEEYREFLNDPGDWTIRRYLPRVWKTLAPLANIGPLQSMWGGSSLAMMTGVFATPVFAGVFEVLAEAGREQKEFSRVMGTIAEDLANLGFPNISYGRAPAPFDVVSDHLRGMAGTMTDMFRYPDELEQTCDLIMADSIRMGSAVLNTKRGNPKRVTSALHRGSDGFMSLPQFERFYWSTLKKLIYTMTDMGIVHVPFYEGNWEQRLEYLLELPKGKTIARFALTDLKMAKDVLKGHTCIMGGVPHSLLQTGSPSEVDEYCKDLIETVGKDGGLILCTSTGITHEAKPENVKAMMDAARKYGVYR